MILRTKNLIQQAANMVRNEICSGTKFGFHFRKVSTFPLIYSNKKRGDEATTRIPEEEASDQARTESQSELIGECSPRKLISAFPRRNSPSLETCG